MASLLSRRAAACARRSFSAAQTLQLVMAERMTEEREKAITQVAESVGELAEIFKEIQVRARKGGGSRGGWRGFLCVVARTRRERVDCRMHL